METHTPVVFFIYNRPEIARRTFRVISEVKPDNLFIIADGPRSIQDEQNCNLTRQVVETIDWDSRVFRNYANTNMGLKHRISSGLDWVFENCEEAIILEDDCVPDPSFFPFCEELLERYRDDERVMCISGNNFQFGRKRGEYSYFFSCIPLIWGWATWRRAWSRFDIKMDLWPEVKQSSMLHDLFRDTECVSYWKDIFDKMYTNRINSWAYAWTYSNWINHAMTIMPQDNLVSNIGFGEGATHTISKDSIFFEMPSSTIRFPLKHPPFLIRDYGADIITMRNNFLSPSKKPLIRFLEKVHLKTPLKNLKSLILHQ